MQDIVFPPWLTSKILEKNPNWNPTLVNTHCEITKGHWNRVIKKKKDIENNHVSHRLDWNLYQLWQRDITRNKPARSCKKWQRCRNYISLHQQLTRCPTCINGKAAFYAAFYLNHLSWGCCRVLLLCNSHLWSALVDEPDRKLMLSRSIVAEPY